MAAQGGGALSGVDGRRGPVVLRQIQAHSALPSPVSTPQEASGGQSGQLPAWGGNWLLRADFSDFRMSENLQTGRSLKECYLVLLLQRRRPGPRAGPGLAQGHKVTQLFCRCLLAASHALAGFLQEPPSGQTCAPFKIHDCSAPPPGPKAFQLLPLTDFEAAPLSLGNWEGGPLPAD